MDVACYGVDVVDVAPRADDRRVHAHQRIERAVVEGGGRPIGIRRVVALVTRRREPGRGVRWVVRRVVVRLVAADAGGRRAREDVVDVAPRAREGRVDADQREDGVVVEAGGPGRRLVLAGAKRRTWRAAGGTRRCDRVSRGHL